MADSESKTLQFSNSGLVLKSDPAVLPDGAYQELTNAVTKQEGALTSRAGTQRLTGTTSYDAGASHPSLLHSVLKLHGTSLGDVRYIGSGTSILRSSSAIPSSGAGMAFTTVAIDTAPSISTLDYPTLRWAGVRFNAGTVGTPYAYFACPSKMVKDDGTMSYPLPNWGIFRPVAPVVATLPAVTVVPSTADILLNNNLVSTIVTSYAGTAPGTLRVTPSSMANVARGVILWINTAGGAIPAVVESTNSTSFTAYMTAVPLTGATGTVVSSSVTATQPNQFTVIDLHSTPLDASFSGVAPDYMTDDVFHIGISMSDPTAFNAVVIYIYVNGTNPDGTGPDYYTYLLNSSTGMTGQFNISKRQFTPAGAAGTGSSTWKHITAIEIPYGSNTTSGATITISNLYFASGFTPGVFDQSSGTLVLPYKWLYTYRNVKTNAEGNPCATMIDDNAQNPFQQAVSLTLTGTSDPQISTAAGAQSIVVYRSGGVFTDGLYRVVGYATNPGAGLTVTFSDKVADADILYADTIEWDNDPPVHSTLSEPISLTWAGWATGSGAAGAYSSFTASAVETGPSATDLRAYLPAGSTAIIGKGTALEETVVVAAWTGPLTVKAWLQNSFASWSGTVHGAFYADSAVGIPCNLAVTSQECIFLAGDPNSPHTLYKSKRARPDSFPVVELATGIAHQITVGSPSDPIMAITEYSGSIICLNLSHIYVVQTFGQQMQEPIETPATRGLVGNYAWCKADNEIWYLSYDGVYSWAGGQSTKRSEAIDPLFKGMTVGPYAPLALEPFMEGSTNVNPKQRATFSYRKNTIIITCQDINGKFMRLRYDLLFNRWSIDYVYDAWNADPTTPAAVTAQYLEPDTGYHLISKAVSAGSGVYWGFLYLDSVGTSDGWVNAVTDGAPIIGAITPASYHLGFPRTNKQWLDFVVDTNNDGAAFGVAAYYDYSATANVADTFAVAAGSSAGRKDVVQSLQAGYGKEARAMTLRLSWSTTVAPTFYSLTFNYRSLGEIQTGRASDWDDLGWPGDKRLYICNITCDIPTGQQVSLWLDTITGSVNNQVVHESIMPFTLKPVTGTFNGPSRVTFQFPMNDLVICKKVRLRPTTITTPFKLLSYDFGEFEKYPPDVVPFTPWSDYGYPHDKYAQQLILDINTDNVAATVGLWVDGASSAAQQFTVNTTTEKRKVNLTLQPNIIGKKFRVVLVPGTNGRCQLFDHNIIFIPANKGDVHATFDWDNLGSPYEKRLYVVTFMYDNNGSGPVTMQMDTLSGTTISTNVQQFSLTGTGRGEQQFSITDGTICTSVRIYPVSDNANFQHWAYNFEKEVYPPNVVPFTEYNDFGYKFDKYANQLILDVNTGGVAATVSLQTESGTAQTLSVTSTRTTRNQILTLSPQLLGKKFRLLNSPGSNGRFQMWSWDLGWLPADKGPVTHSYDWDTLEHPFDKHLKTITFEYDAVAAGPFSVYVDTITGPNGTTITSDVYAFTLSGAGRSVQTFAFPDGAYVKAIRIHPATTTVTFKEWKYIVDAEKMPADITLWTDWNQFGYPCDKIARELVLDVNTGGVPATVALQADGGTVQTFTVTTTINDRNRVLPTNSDLIGRAWRIMGTPGSGGVFQLFNWSLNFVKDPCAVNYYDTYESTFGYPGWKAIKKLRIHYSSTGPVTASIYREGGVLFYQITFPTMPDRDVYEVLVPAIYNGVLNKSRVYRIAMTTTGTFKLYADSQIDFIWFGSDQMGAFMLAPINENMQLPVA